MFWGRLTTPIVTEHGRRNSIEMTRWWHVFFFVMSPSRLVSTNSEAKIFAVFFPTWCFLILTSLTWRLGLYAKGFFPWLSHHTSTFRVQSCFLFLQSWSILVIPLVRILRRCFSTTRRFRGARESFWKMFDAKQLGNNLKSSELPDQSVGVLEPATTRSG